MSFSFSKWNNLEPAFNSCKLDATQRGGGSGGSSGGGDEPDKTGKHLDTCPPPYHDLGKAARDLFNCGYYFGLLSLDVKTRSPNNVEISTSWTENMEKNKLYGSVEAKFNLPEYNLTITEKVNKNCFLNTELSYKNKLVRGLTLSFGGAFSPRRGLRMGLLKGEWCNRYCFANANLEIGKKLTFLTSSLVLGCGGLFGGVQWKYDLHNCDHADFNFGFSYINDNFILHTCVNNGSEYGGSVYHKVAPEIEVGIDLKWWTKSPEPLYGVACRYELDKGIALRGKINSSSELGVSYEKKLSDGITLTMSTFFDLTNIVLGRHKFGLALRLEP